MIDLTNKQVDYALLEEFSKEGYTSITMHIAASTIPIPMERMRIYDLEMKPLNKFLDAETFIYVMGGLQTGMKGAFVHKNTITIHFSFDEKLIEGKREQDFLIGLLTTHGFTNARDLNNDGLNDSDIEDIDWSQVPERFFIIHSRRESKHIPITENESEVM